MRFAVLFLTAVTLAGCGATGPRHGGEFFMSDAEIQAKDDRECQGYGARPGSQEYVSCRMNLHQSRTNIAVARRF